MPLDRRAHGGPGLEELGRGPSHNSPTEAMMLCTGRREEAWARPGTPRPRPASSCLKVKAEFSSLVMLM